MARIAGSAASALDPNAAIVKRVLANGGLTHVTEKTSRPQLAKAFARLPRGESFDVTRDGTTRWIAWRKRFPSSTSGFAIKVSGKQPPEHATAAALWTSLCGELRAAHGKPSKKSKERSTWEISPTSRLECLLSASSIGSSNPVEYEVAVVWQFWQ